MMGCVKSDRGQLFYEFHLGDAVPEDHLVRKIDAALDLSWLRSELAPHYSSMGRPSIDPELMIRMLVVGYVFAIRSERFVRLSRSIRNVKIPNSNNEAIWVFSISVGKNVWRHFQIGTGRVTA